MSSISDHCFVDPLNFPVSSLVPPVSFDSFSQVEESSSSFCLASTTKRERSRLCEYRDPPAALTSPPDDTLSFSVSAPILVYFAGSDSPPVSPSFSPISPPDLDSDWDVDLDCFIQSHPNQNFDSDLDVDWINL